MNIPSIFNDVIGPVMRGPSSSHSAAAVRIGKVGRDLMGGALQEVQVRMDLGGSLPTTYLSQGSDMGLCGGLMGFEVDDERLLDYKAELKKAGLAVKYTSDHCNDPHPNTYNLTLKSQDEEHSLVALSTGGGMIEVIQVDGMQISFHGDRYGLVIWVQTIESQCLEYLKKYDCHITHSHSTSSPLIFCSRLTPFSRDFLAELEKLSSVQKIRLLEPLLPVLTTPESRALFTSGEGMAAYAKNNGVTDLAELGLRYEAARGGATTEEVLVKALELVDIFTESIRHGLAGTHYQDRMLGYQSGNYLSKSREQLMMNLGVLDRIIPYVTALMETKSSMGVIVAAPTAGSCGGLPGAVLGLGDAMGLSRESQARGLLAAGAVGVLIATRSTFSAEVCGCQAECGVSSGMAAAAMVSMLGGDYTRSLAAASIALQNIFGMVCDPVANRVEVPCLGKNILAASNGASCANLALAGYDDVIPFDEVVQAMDSVGRAIPHELRCTALGGLSLTPTSRRIQERLGAIDQ